MRRIMAFALLALFSFSLIEPALFAADPESGLPACCRRFGRHPCATILAEASSGRAIQASLCRYFPASPVKSLPIAGFLKSVQAVSVSLLSSPPCLPSSESPHRLAFRSTCQKRGPPSLSLI